MRAKSNKPKRNIWTDPSPYGTYEGELGSPSQWRSFFDQRFTGEQIKDILKADSPYGVLGVTNDANQAEIKSAYYKLIKIHHPDLGGDAELAKKIIAAYQHLTGN